MWERASKVGAIDIGAFFLWDIYIFTSRTKDLHTKPKFQWKSTLTLDVLNSSDIPIGKTACLSHKTLGQTPNFPSKNFSLIMARPVLLKFNYPQYL